MGEEAFSFHFGLEALSKVDLVDISGGDVILSDGDAVFELCASEVGLPGTELS